MVDIIQNLRRLWDDLERVLEPSLWIVGHNLVSYLPSFRDSSDGAGGAPKLSNKYVWMCLTRDLPVPYHTVRYLTLDMPVITQSNLHAGDEVWKKALVIAGPLKNLCEFIDDEWVLISLQRVLCETLLKRLLVIQNSLLSYKTILNQFNTEERFNPHIGFRRPQVQRLHSVYECLENIVKVLGQVVYPDMNNIFDQIEDKLTGTE